MICLGSEGISFRDGLGPFNECLTISGTTVYTKKGYIDFKLAQKNIHALHQF